jgi:thioredoxin reductase (NADPH)
VFVEMGYIAKTDFVKGLVQLNNSNEIIVDKYCATSRQGIFAAGDITDVPYKQAVISAGQGSIAALSAYNYIQKLKGGKSSPIKADWKSSKSSDVHMQPSADKENKFIEKNGISEYGKWYLG